MRKLVLIFGLVVCLNANAATGNDLLAWLNKPGTAEEVIGISYVRGYLDGQIYFKVLFERESITGLMPFCMPQAATAIQASDIIKKYLVDSPAERHQDANTLVFKALRNAWPCS